MRLRSSRRDQRRFDGRVDHPIDDGFEQRLLRAEVVVEGALRGADGGEHVVDAELLIALGGDELLSGIDELVTPRCVGNRVDRTGRQSDPPD